MSRYDYYGARIDQSESRAGHDAVGKDERGERVRRRSGEKADAEN